MRPLYFLAAAAILAVDQLTKWMVLTRLSATASVTVIPGMLDLVLSQNRGIAFGMLGGVSSGAAFALIVLVSAAALTVVSWLLWRGGLGSRYGAAALVMILGGAAGNFLDRVVRGSVVDFLDFYFRSYHWYTFNVADSAIVVGAGLLMIELFRRPVREQETGNREQ